MAAPYQWFDDAMTTASARSSGDPTLTLADASKFGASGAWSTPALISVRSVGMTIVVLVATGRTGNVLSISGAAPGWTDAPTSAGASALNAVTKRDMELIWAAIDAASASTGTVTSVSVVSANGVSGSVAAATSTPAISLTLGAITPSSVLAAGTVAGSNLSGVNTGDQTITLGGDLSGSGTGSISATIASNAVTTTKIAANAATYAKIQAAAGAGLLGATGAGNHQLLALGTGLSLAGSTLNASGGSGTVTTASVVSANGFAGSVATATSTPAITLSTSVTGLLKGNGTAISAATAGTDYQSPITTGTTSQYIRGDLSLATFAVSGCFSFPSDGSLAIVSGSGTLASPYVLRSRRIKTIGWIVADTAAGSTGDASTVVYAPFACKLTAARMWARTNPTSTITGQVKGAGSNLLGSALSLASGAAGPTSATISTPPSIAAGAAIVATWSAMPADSRGVVIEIEIMED